jgi:hypothetical protein
MLPSPESGGRGWLYECLNIPAQIKLRLAEARGRTSLSGLPAAVNGR